MVKGSVVLSVSCFLVLLSSSTVYGATSTWPAPIPLFHKSPYFNAWVDASSSVSNSPAARWPEFFNREALQWFIGLRVDNTSYEVQGADAADGNYTTANTVSSDITATQTRFTITAGPVSVNVTYITPVELQDWTLHSFPFVYAAFDIISSDGNPHAVQLYIDATLQLLSSDDSTLVTWNTNITTHSIYHVARQQTLQTLTENNDMSEDGSQILAYSLTPGASMTWQTCFAATSRTNFSLHGKLENTSDTNFRAIGDLWPVLAYALDLGNITETANTLVFGIGLIRDPVLSYRIAEKTENLSHLWYSRWSDIGSAVDDFLASYPSASSRANAFDDAIQLSVSSIASQLNMSTSTAAKLVDLHILNLRQTVGSLEFTTSNPGKSLTLDDVRVFMKDVGYSSRTNPVEILYASFPAFLSLNTTLAGKLLEPLLESQAPTNDYAAPDLGNTWPVIQGSSTNQSLAMDSCGAMLIMALAHARKSGDGSLLFNYYYLLRGWADYLVQSTQHPSSYMSSDGLYSSDANLALKGIMGLYAMGTINSILQARGADASKTYYYLDTANTYAQDWLNQALSSDHIMATYGSNSTWAMIYNLFAPRLLGATIIPERIYEIQALWYSSRNGSAATFGLPFDSTQALAKAHWTLFSASSVFNATSFDGRDDLISMVHSRSFWQSGINPNPSTYSPIDGTLPAGAASPAMGAVYSLLALNLTDLKISLPSGTLANSPSVHHVPVILGATFGTLGGLILLAAVGFFWQRYRRSKHVNVNDPLEELSLGQQGASTLTPFTDIPLVTSQEQNGRFFMRSTKRNSQILPIEKFSTDMSPHQTTVSGDHSPNNNEDGDDNNLRREVQQLRRIVETLTTEQVSVIHQPEGSSPAEPPPMYTQ